MIAKCGDIYRWHWQHIRDRNCDSWKEHETRWHREWKEKFPTECREVVIQNNGELHIADVLTKLLAHGKTIPPIASADLTIPTRKSF